MNIRDAVLEQLRIRYGKHISNIISSGPNRTEVSIDVVEVLLFDDRVELSLDFTTLEFTGEYVIPYSDPNLYRKIRMAVGKLHSKYEDDQHEIDDGDSEDN